MHRKATLVHKKPKYYSTTVQRSKLQACNVRWAKSGRTGYSALSCRRTYSTESHNQLVRFPGVAFAQGMKPASWEPFSLPQTSTERYLVVLFGWLAADERYLQKYVQFYTKRGIIQSLLILKPLI